AGCADPAVPRAADGRPLFPPGLPGSISHTGRLAVAVVAPGAGAVGVDIEDAEISARVARFVLRDAERRTLLAPGSGFTGRDLFAAKEAAFKALYRPDASDGLVFWRIGLSRRGDALAASHQGALARVRVWSGPDLSLALALRPR
ncbi:MAG TPA: 4'-phosphopantetheinyl transferase superfamily protein, partial [Actinocrinis sp.]|nr:4'-phosphopantetheinyl transferase superfamily protein [Actinocrinis sp.]